MLHLYVPGETRGGVMALAPTSAWGFASPVRPLPADTPTIARERA